MTESLIKFRVVVDGKIFGYEKLEGNIWKSTILEFNPKDFVRWNEITITYRAKSVIRNLFSGQKDSNRKDIYEGDIVISDSDAGSFEVKWDSDSSSFLVGDDLWPNAELTIIGNIYENPELLKA